ncbi:ribonuclease H family protein [Aliiroseovarius crassostreae]|uniref:ribonuclease H family protein n=1 Tax=Aliiroseovarius crassostreae TaxID=154981 RepID=UPI0021FA9EA9|nr:ribonuclease H [Aliiroseovarius crassostreae]UWP89102.1 ribonuclease HI [Aliiroseovarius crassostreae]
MEHPTATALAEQTHIAYTEGASHGNPGPGAWAHFTHNPDGTFTEASGFLRDTTNQRAELLAAICALEMTSEGARVHIYSDSAYVVNGATQWLEAWKVKNWRNAQKKSVKNRDLWERLDGLLDTRTVTFEHIPGHAGIPGNERVNALAQDTTTGRAGFGPITFAIEQ